MLRESIPLQGSACMPGDVTVTQLETGRVLPALCSIEEGVVKPHSLFREVNRASGGLLPTWMSAVMAPLRRPTAASGGSDGSSLYTLSAMAVVAASTSKAGSQPRLPTA